MAIATKTAMEKVGVDGAILVSSFSMYQYDGSYAVQVRNAHPGRFGVVKPLDTDDPALADIISEWKNTPGTVGVRIMMTAQNGRRPGDPGVDLVLREAVKPDFPVNLLCWEDIDAGNNRDPAMARSGDFGDWATVIRAHATSRHHTFFEAI